MAISTILYITLALLLALGFSFFQYLYNRDNRNKREYIFFSLRASAIFIVLLLLINPKIISTDYELEKTQLTILSDNSQSISHLEQEENLKMISKALSSNEKIQDKFRVSGLNFGERLTAKDSLDFTATQTDIYNALFETQNMLSGQQSAVVLLSDGNQSLGRDYQYFNVNKNVSVYPVIIGDTTTYTDLSIERINANRYAFLNNQFPVEIFSNYRGKEEVLATVNIRSGNTGLFSEQIKFSEEVKSQVINTRLSANSLGVQSYTVEVEGLLDEKNLLNNSQNFAVEVIDERTSVLILSDISHPDLGALEKSIESNQQRSVDIKYLDDKILEISNYQLIIIYQLNKKFNKYIEEILENNYSFLMITGSKTDWDYLNTLNLGYSKNSVNQSQEFFPVYNNTFSPFQFENIGFDDFPPLIDKFGSLDIEDNRFNILLFQELEGVNTKDPLLAVSSNSPKSGVLFGEGFWKWRAKSFRETKSFQQFDDFFGRLVQNLAKKQSRQRLSIDAESFYYANQNVIISAQYFDENYQFDPGAGLKIIIENKETGNSFSSDLILKNNFYQFDGGDLPADDYSFQINVSEGNISKSGSFEVIDFNVEQQFVSANLNGMRAFADKNNTRVYHPDELDGLINSLLSNDKFKPVQKSREKSLPLIDWYYLLFILVLVLAAEWFYRKYLGLI